MSNKYTDIIDKLYKAHLHPLALSLDITGDLNLIAVRQVALIRQSAIDDYLGTCSIEHKLYCLDMFENCNEQIKLALGL